MELNFTWQDQPATEKQLRFIEDIESVVSDAPKFEGKTKGNASKYIDIYIEAYKEICAEMANWDMYRGIAAESINE